MNAPRHPPPVKSAAPQSPAPKPSGARTVVIGGGIAGLATAILLAREGHHVTLLEQRSELGGRAATYREAGFRFELGPSWYLMPEVFDHFYALAGTSTPAELDLVRLDPAYRVFPQPSSTSGNSDAIAGASDPITLRSGSHETAALFESLEPGSSKQLAQYLQSAAETYELALDYFLYNPFTRLSWLTARSVLKRLPSLLRLLFTSLDRHISARFSNLMIRQILGFPAVFLGTSPQEAPAMYHLMSKLDLTDGVLYPMGGFTRFITSLTRLAEEAGVRMITEATVTRIHTSPRAPATSATRESSGTQRYIRTTKKATIRGVTWRDPSGTDHLVPSEMVVSAADLHHTETQLLAPALQTYPQKWWDNRVSGPGGVVITLGVTGELPQLPHHSLFFVQQWEENFEAIFGKNQQVRNPTSIYVCKPSATDPEVAPSGHENLFILVPVPADPSLGADHGVAGQEDPRLQQIADHVINQVATWAGIDDLPSRIITRQVIGPADFAATYNSWHGGMLGPAHILRQSAMFRAQNESKKVAGLYYAGATTAPGVGVPMCLISAELVLKRIRGDHSPGPTKEGSLKNGPQHHDTTQMRRRP